MDTAHDATKSSELRFRSGTQANAARQRRPEGNLTPSSQGELRLRQVYPAIDDPVEAEYYPDIDIIAIHGLDTNSPDTWKWRAPSIRKTGPGTEVNWLSDLDMLPKHIGQARIFTCDWPADLLQHSSVPTTLDECAQSLHDSIGQHLKSGARRPIFFIASCLGGIILMKALEIDNQHAEDDATSPSLTSATRGIVFLATPFRGTAFRNIPVSLLKALIHLQDQAVSSLIDYALSATPELDELARGFITLTKRHKYEVFTFWEGKNTVLLRKFGLAWIVSRWTFTIWPVALASTWRLGLFSPWLLVVFLLWLPLFLSYKPQPLVNKHSATLSDFGSERLDRTHVMMNKFAHGKCIECKKSCMESKDSNLVTGKIEEMLGDIRTHSPLQRADDWIHDKYYTTDRLKIERLSGEVLSMEQCYINLAIVVKPKKNTQYAEKESDAAPRSSPFSLVARQNVETPNKEKQVDLPSLFDMCKGSNGKKMQPRILIRGRAGVGKTTLCKKMVHEFGTPEFRNWNHLFHRVLWLPLRQLNEWTEPPFNLEKLFLKIYFNQNTEKEGADLAHALCDDVKRGRTLFIFDGLDEIDGKWGSEHGMSEFLKDLLNQPNVVITSRPHVSLPANVNAPDVELETIGFYPHQVKDYIQAAFTDTERKCTDTQKIDEVQSYLQAHQLIQDLVRIPIQLDALCFTWDENFSADNVPQSMTEIFEAISLKLWQKDIHRLHRKPESECRTMNIIRVKEVMGKHMNLLGALAFSGLYNNILNFDLDYRKRIYGYFNLSVTESSVGKLSFLRTSDPSVGNKNRQYHFLHLTFQEYFAARYFVQQWKIKQPLCCMHLNRGGRTEVETAIFLQENKYEPRYNIFWRFVAGLLSVEGEALRFFEAVEESRDLLGPTHQYLVMHCLSEVRQGDPTFAAFRTKLEKTLKRWLLFECRLTKECYLASEMECPEQVLTVALTEASEEEKEILLLSLCRRAAIPSIVLHLIVPWLDNGASTELKIAILDFMKHQHKNLPGEMLQRIGELLDDEDFHIQWEAVRTLQGQANLADNLSQRIAALLEDMGQVTRRITSEVPQFQTSFTNQSLLRIEALVKGEDEDVHKAVLGVMQGQANLTEDLLEYMAQLLTDKEFAVREAAARAFRSQTNPTDGLLQRVAALLRKMEDKYVQEALLNMLQHQGNLTDDLLQCVKNGLDNEECIVQLAAVKVLQGQTNLTDSLLQRVAEMLQKDKTKSVREEAVKILQGQTNLTDNLLQYVIGALDDEDEDIREEALEVLQHQDNLTDDLLQHVIDALSDEWSHVRWAATRVLQGQVNLTEDLLKRIARLLKKKKNDIRHAAIAVFRGRADLTDSLLRCIAALLKDGDHAIQVEAVEVLLCQTTLPLDILAKHKSSLFQVLVVKSFKEHLYCSDGSFIGAGSRHIPLIGKWGDRVSDETLNLRKVWNVPLPKTKGTPRS